MDYDQVLEHVGQFGLWQIMVCLLASLAAMAEAFMTLQVGSLENYLTLAACHSKTKVRKKVQFREAALFASKARNIFYFF